MGHAIAGETVLVHISTAHDRPGLLAAVLERLAGAGAGVRDLEQITVFDRLHLSLLVELPSGRDVLKELLMFGWEQSVHVEFDLVDGDQQRRRAPGAVVTVLAEELTATKLSAAATAVAEAGGNVERISRLALYPVTCYELLVRVSDPAHLANCLMAAARAHTFDVAVQRHGIARRSMRLVAFDVDSTLIQNEVIDLLADEAGCGSEVADITRRAMEGGLDFEAALRARVALLAGLDMAAIERARGRVRLTPGARTVMRTLHRLGFVTAIVSGGFTVFTDELAKDLGVHHAVANELEVVDGRLTGRLVGRVVDRRRKAEVLAELARSEGIELSQTVAVGDGANDLDMLALAGLGIAFNAKPVVRDAAPTALSVPYLDAILFLFGLGRDALEDVAVEDVAVEDVASGS